MQEQDLEDLKKDQTELLEIKNTILDSKSSMDRHTRFDDLKWEWVSQKMRNEILQNVAQSNKEMKNMGNKVRCGKEWERLNLAKERRKNRVGAIFKQN